MLQMLALQLVFIYQGVRKGDRRAIQHAQRVVVLKAETAFAVNLKVAHINVNVIMIARGL